LLEKLVFFQHVSDFIPSSGFVSLELSNTKKKKRVV